MVLSSRSVYPRARSLHPSSGALPSGFIARSCQPVLSITSISTQKHFSLNLEYLEVKFYVILTSRFLHRCLHEQNSSQRGSLMKRENSTWCIQSLGNFIVFYQYHLWNIYFLCLSIRSKFSSSTLVNFRVENILMCCQLRLKFKFKHQRGNQSYSRSSLCVADFISRCL